MFSPRAEEDRTMTRNRKILSWLGIAVGSMVLSALLLAPQALASQRRFNAVINTTDPCTGAPLRVHGTTKLSIRTAGGGVIVHEQFFGRQHGYLVRYRGQGQYPAPRAFYDIRVHGSIEGRSYFRSRAIDRIFTDNGFVPTGDRFQRIRNFCN